MIESELDREILIKSHRVKGGINTSQKFYSFYWFLGSPGLKLSYLQAELDYSLNY